MKPRFSKQTDHALTLVEVLAVIAVLVLLVAVLLPALAISKHKSSHLGCVNYLKQIGLAYRVWEGDHGDEYPMFVSATNGGAMEMVATGNVAASFQVMSNELGTPKILHCPEDKDHIEAGSFAVLANSNISYFVGLDAKESQPQIFLSGDDNFLINGIRAKSGVLELYTNSAVDWTKARHDSICNIGLADGSVWQGTSSALRRLLRDSGIATNRLALP